MSAGIHIDQNFTTFTNLDVISGAVIVQTIKPIDVNAITIKLEGESRTRLLPPQNGPRRDRAQLEFHKILYKVATVFPPDAINAASSRGQYTLPAGEHRYPFSFKLPFNTACLSSNSALPAISLNGLRGLEFAQPPTQHLRRPLPPTLRGFPGEAEIRYYLKATVARSGMLNQNIRVLVPFDFCPIEPPRPAQDGAESFARTKYQFVNQTPVEEKPKWNLFSSKPRQDTRQPLDKAPHISVETRLPEPPILTSNKPVPLRILIANVEGPSNTLVLSSLQVDLVAFTHVRAHNVVTTETATLTLAARPKLDIPLNLANGSFEVPSDLWSSATVDRSLCPSFETCNIARTYELVIRVGINHGSNYPAFVTLRHQPRLFSGIAPPPELLATLSKNKQPQPPLPTRPEQRKPVAGQAAPPNYTAPPPSDAPGPNDAPPSYEDAVADALPTVHVGERGGYVPPAARGEDGLLPTDEKRGWRG